MAADASVDDARRLFPRGLRQPPEGFRFGADALLLASFAAALPGERALDLGTGCGPAGLGLLLARNDAATTVLGLDMDPEMTAAANANAAHLGFAARFVAALCDVRDIRAAPLVPAQGFDLVLANPPYRDPGSGRRAATPGRDAARFATDGGLPAFAAAAAYALRTGGALALVHLAERLTHIVATLGAAGLETKRLLPVAARREAPARQILLLARRGSRPGLRLDPPLALYEGTGEATRLTEAALRFCPFLACNAKAVPPAGP